MARTSKTRIGGESGEQAERNIRAAESGASLRQRAHEALMQQEAQGREELARGAESIGRFTQGEREREQRETQFSQEMALRQQQLTQQGKQHTAEMAQRGELSKAEMAQQREFEVGRQSLQQQQLDIEGARAGVQRGPSATTSPLVDERMRRTQQEMERGGAQTQGIMGPPAPGDTGGQMGPPSPDQQRRAEMMGRPDLEKPGIGQSIIPTQQGLAKQEIEASKARTAEINARARAMEAQQRYARAMRQNNKEEMDASKKTMMEFVNTSRKLQETFASGDIEGDDWRKLESLASDNPDPALQKEVAERKPGPRIKSLLESRTAQYNMEFMVGSEGELPEKIDLDNPAMKPWQREVERLSGMIGFLEGAARKFGGSFTGMMGIRSLDDKTRLLYKVSAATLLERARTAKARPVTAATGKQPLTAAQTLQKSEQQAAAQPSPAVSRLRGESRPQQARGL